MSITIAIDAMGGDFGPEVTIPATLECLKANPELNVIMVGDESVLKDISLHVGPGEQVALVGPSGIGKTTLISLILQFYRTTMGEIYFDGSDPFGGLALYENNAEQNGGLRLGYAGVDAGPDHDEIISPTFCHPGYTILLCHIA